MKRSHLAIVVCGLVLSSGAPGQGSSGDSDAKEASAVLTELSQRSGIAESELGGLLANCDASQTSMNFCAWRDQIVAERGLNRAVADKVAQLPKCSGAIESKLTAWRWSRDTGCEKSATKDYGGGSMKPMVQAMCMQAEALEMTKRVTRMRGCK